MLKSTEAFSEAVVGTIRRMALRAAIDIVSPDLSFGSVTGSEQAIFSKPDQLHDRVFQTSPYITVERNRWMLNKKFVTIPNMNPLEDMGFVSRAISKEDGSFGTPQEVSMAISNVKILQACSVFFSDKDWDGVPEDFKIDVMQGGVSYHTKEFVGNTEKSVSVDGFTVYNPDQIRVTVTKWSMPGRRVRAIEIIPGIYANWDGGMVVSMLVTQQANPSCLTIPYGTCSLTINNIDRRFEPRNKSGLFKSIEDRQPIKIDIGVRLADGTFEYKSLGKYYQYSGGWITSDNDISITWNLVDIIGLIAKRKYVPPDVLPTDLDGWIKSIVSQLGEAFEDEYIVDDAYKSKPLTVEKSKIEDIECGELLRYACMACGVWPRAGSETGKLVVEPYWNEGNKIKLRDMPSYPTIEANNDLAVIIFSLGGDGEKVYVSGNSVSSNKTADVKNPFIKTRDEALQAAKQILSTYGGNVFNIVSRGNPSSEIGDVDTVWLDKSSAATGRRIYQEFNMSSGVLADCKSSLLQADGAFLYEEKEVITKSGQWRSPAGKTKLRVIIVGHGEDGKDGTGGSWDEDGVDGADGRGAKVWSGTINVNDGQLFNVDIGDVDTTFGMYSSANGSRFEYGYTDIQSGDSYARTGVQDPKPNSGDGGAGGEGGSKGYQHEESFTMRPPLWWPFPDDSDITVTTTVTDSYPQAGTKGAKGATGCVVVYWEK